MSDNAAQLNSLDWHSRWKSFPHHNQVHWLVLVVIVWATGLVFMGQMVNLKNSDKQLAQAEVLGVRTSRSAQPENTIENIPAVKGESVGPITDNETAAPVFPSNIDIQDIRPARNMNQHLQK